MKSLLLALILPIVYVNCLGQKPWPYKPGVAENFTGTILSSDSSALKTITYNGQQDKIVFDRRVKKRTTINAYVFDVTWNDGPITAQVIANPDIGDFTEIANQAKKHAQIVGRLPYDLRSLIKHTIHGGYQSYGGGNRGILFYTEKTVEHEATGKLDEIVVHEAAHNLGNVIGTSEMWRAAQTSDNAFISKYAQEFPDREDVSESFLAWLILRYYRNRITEQQANIISSQIPARLKYFDEIKPKF